MGLVKRGDTFHFRCRVPSDLIELLGRLEIHATLRTDTRRIALQREEVIQANLAIWFQRLRIALSFPPKTGPLFLDTEGGCDGSETTFGRGYTEASA